MITIKKANEFIVSILRKDSNDILYHCPSLYNIYVKNPNNNLVYSTLTNGLYILSNQEYNTLINNNIANKEIYLELIEKRLVVPVDCNEYLLTKQLQQVVSLTQQKNDNYLNTFTILTTTDCNARCFYCYEKGLNRINMNLDTAEGIVQFILKNYKEKSVIINWFGGEPLYNLSVIDYITNRLKESNVLYSSNMISNGYLFSKDIVKKAISNWCLKKVQITLDGTEQIYNKYKAYIGKNEISPFVRVTDNIEKLILAGITVNIRLNMDNNNADDLSKLIDWVAKRYPYTDNLHIYPAIILNKEKPMTSDECESLMKSFEKISQQICSKGLSRFTLERNASIKTATCMANNPHAVVITPDGKLQRCEHVSDEEVYGDIWSPNINLDIYNSWFTIHEETEKCKTCTFFPNCRHLKKCKTFIKCTPEEINGKLIRHREAMIKEYQAYIQKN